MTKRFLGIWGTSDRLQVEITDTPGHVLARPHGRVSGLLPARRGGSPAKLDAATTVAFLFGRKPTDLLAAIANDLGKDDSVLDRTYLTHGHANAVLLLRSPQEWVKVKAAVEDLLTGYEVWSVADGHVTVDQLEVVEPTLDGMPAVPSIACDELGYESASQVRQFNANLAVLARVVWSYAPEVWPLVEQLGALVEDIAKTLQENADGDDVDFESIRERIRSETVLIETNSVLSLYCSQLGSGTLPLHQANFPVGEYSLLGIGGMCRGAWRLYHHLNQTFAQFDHASVLREKYPDMAAFYPYGASDGVRDFSTWRGSKYSLERHPTADYPKPRYHVPYFSSRWGFHESLHSISLSWQCLYASATKEWNLLTLTHEFLHSQVRALFAEILRTDSQRYTSEDMQPDTDLAKRIVERYNATHNGDSALESLQIAYADLLVVYHNAEFLTRTFRPEEPTLEVEFTGALTVDFLRELVRLHSVLVHEVAVHVLDFRYVYAGRDEEYVNSIWSSWSLVPGVADQIDHYVLRTLCALSATADRDSERLFEDVRGRMLGTLEPLSRRDQARPTIAQAVALLRDSDACRQLQIAFNALQYVVELTQTFFHDSRLNTALLDDPATFPSNDPFEFGVDPGEYQGVKIASPIGFLLDRFPHYSDHASADAEFESVWQMLQLI